MGFLTIDGLAAKLEQLVEVGHVASEASIREGVAILKAEALTTLTAVGVKGFRLRGVGNGSTASGNIGAALGVAGTVIGSGRNMNGVVHATGPWQFIERDTPRHMVGTGAFGDNHGQVMHFGNGEWATGPFEAGGSHGKHPWRIAMESGGKKVEKLYEKQLSAAIRKAF